MSAVQMIPQSLSWATMPLSVYREVAAHLCQLSGVEVELLSQTATQFDYTLSQVGGLRIQVPPSISETDAARVLEILNYYGDRFGSWQVL
jgi:hypothetical protein